MRRAGGVCSARGSRHFRGRDGDGCCGIAGMEEIPLYVDENVSTCLLDTF